jgi:hypothetical protein
MTAMDAELLAGFTGFIPVGELHTRMLESVPLDGGVYLVVLPSGVPRPAFLAVSSGGHFKGKDPSVSAQKLAHEWVDETRVLYVGSGACLRTRIAELICFAFGVPIGHWGGRLLWQLAERDAFLVAWKVIPDGKAKEVETEILEAFRVGHAERLPFANLKR